MAIENEADGAPRVGAGHWDVHAEATASIGVGPSWRTMRPIMIAASGTRPNKKLTIARRGVYESMNGICVPPVGM